jgi:hypothetical protein
VLAGTRGTGLPGSYTGANLTPIQYADGITERRKKLP